LTLRIDDLFYKWKEHRRSYQMSIQKLNVSDQGRQASMVLLTSRQDEHVAAARELKPARAFATDKGKSCKIDRNERRSRLI
jgi:hypothetical protein